MTSCTFSPTCKRSSGLKFEEIDYLGYDDSPYDALLDTYEPGPPWPNSNRCSPRFVTDCSNCCNASRKPLHHR